MHISGSLARLVGGTALISASFLLPAAAGASPLDDSATAQGAQQRQAPKSDDDLYDDADEAFKSMAQLVGTIAQRIADQPGRKNHDHDRSSGAHDPHAKGANCYQRGGTSPCDQPSDQDKSGSTSRSANGQPTEQK